MPLLGCRCIDAPAVLAFLDPYSNRIEIVSYDNVQFTKAPNLLRGMGLSKNEKVIEVRRLDSTTRRGEPRRPLA